MAAFVLVPLLAVGGSDSFRAALDFTTGVLSLLSLTASIAWGLIATDRLLLSPRHRLVAQAVHRATATASLGFLVLHATVKVSLGHVELIGALVPFGLGVSGTSGLIGFGSLAGFLMVIAGTTGALRSALAGNVKVAGRWRTLHMLAYPAWSFALVHGLFAGRPAATWVVVMYCLALVAVAGAVSVRLLPRPAQRRLAGRVLGLPGGGSEGRSDDASQRDLAQAPLPGLPGPSGAAAFGRGNGLPPQRPFEADLQRETVLGRTALGRPRQQARLAPPAPQLYEAPPSLASEPATSGSGLGSRASTPAGLSADTPTGAGAGLGAGAGTGISAAYRAVSLAGEPSAPLAERIPMTEELPVVPDDGPSPGLWPTPSPPPPAQAFVAEFPPQPSGTFPTETPPLAQMFMSEPVQAVPPSFDPPPPYDPAGYGSQAPGTSFGSSPYTARQPDAAPYGTSAFTAPSRYEAPAAAPYPLSEPAYGTSSAAYDPADPAAYDDHTQAMPGPLFPPQAGEPWNTPAGDRP
ncbi:hypothetical protein ACWEFL_06700 [Streptomyces sp. NPDC004838]